MPYLLYLSWSRLQSKHVMIRVLNENGSARSSETLYAYSFMLYILLLPCSSLFDFFSFFVWQFSSITDKPKVYLMSIRWKSPFIEAIFERSSSSIDVIGTINIRLCQTASQSYPTFSPDSSSRFVSIESLSLIVKASIVTIRLSGAIRHSQPLYVLIRMLKALRLIVCFNCSP